MTSPARDWWLEDTDALVREGLALAARKEAYAAANNRLCRCGVPYGRHPTCGLCGILAGPGHADRELTGGLCATCADRCGREFAQLHPEYRRWQKHLEQERRA